ncbi:MAG: SufE family protein [Pseudomonadota bacterium]
MSIEDAAQQIRDEFDFLEDWEDRYAHIIDLGKSNTPLDDHERNEDTRVRGCASQVWLLTATDAESRILVRAESDAMIVSGLISLLIRLFSEQRAEDIIAFDTDAFLEDIGVKGALTAQRSNGLASMIARIREDASALTASAAS